MVSNPSIKPSNEAWTKSLPCLYRYNPTGKYFARVRFGGKLYRNALGTTDYQLARRKLAEFKDGLGRTDERESNTSFDTLLDKYADTFGGLSESSRKDKRAIIEKLRETWFGIEALPLRTIKPSLVKAWMSRNYGNLSASSYNAALTVVRDAFEMAVEDRIISENPAKSLTYRKRNVPVRLTPSLEQFKAIVASIRGQKFNRDAEQSGDFVEFLGLAGLGQAEAASITVAHIDLEAARISVYRHKTSTPYVVPIYPQLRPLVEKLCKGKEHDQRLFSINEARKALANACTRLKLPQFTHRALRRMFITRAIEKGIDVKVIAEWQGHRDGGKLILQTYSHVNAAHSTRMAALMTDGDPENVIRLAARGR